jgi:hypothetical protein
MMTTTLFTFLSRTMLCPWCWRNLHISRLFLVPGRATFAPGMSGKSSPNRQPGEPLARMLG